jgi:Mannosyltransferase (PIG-V)
VNGSGTAVMTDLMPVPDELFLADPGGRHALDRRLPLPAAAALVYAGIRAVSVLVAWMLLRHGRFRGLGWSVQDWSTAFDGRHYLRIVSHGYAHAPGLAHASSYAWFPGYPAAIDALAWLPWAGAAGAGMVVTIVAGLAAAWGLARLGVAVTGDRRVSVLLVALWSVAPGSVVLSMLYSEALFCALAVWALLALAERRWLTAAVLADVAGLVHSTAVALIAAVAVAALSVLPAAVRTRAPFSVWWRPLAAASLAPLGLLSYWAYVAAGTGRADGWFWIEAHDCGASADWGAGTLHAAEQAIIGTTDPGVMLTVLVIAAGIGLTAWSVLAERLPAWLHAYTLTVVALAVTSPASFLGSKPRFLLPALLLGLPLARCLAPLPNRVLIPLTCTLAATSTWFGLYLMSTRWAP